MSGVMNQYFTGKFEGHDKTILFYQSWRPLFCERVIVIVHGLGEHSGRYDNLVNYFSQQGFSVYGYDQRGHGRSKGQRGYLRSFIQLTGDLRSFLNLVSIHENQKPIYLFGHSLGGLVALRYMIETQNKSGVVPAGVILSNPTLRIIIDIPRWKEVLSGFLSKYVPRLSLYNEIDYEYLSHDPAVSSLVKADPLCHQKITARFYHEILASIDWIKRNRDFVRIPILFLVGGKDQIIDPKGAEEFYHSVEFAQKELKMYPTFYHELINEIGKEGILSDMNEWLQRLGKERQTA